MRKKDLKEGRRVLVKASTTIPSLKPYRGWSGTISASARSSVAIRFTEAVTRTTHSSSVRRLMILHADLIRRDGFSTVTFDLEPYFCGGLLLDEFNVTNLKGAPSQLQLDELEQFVQSLSE